MNVWCNTYWATLSRTSSILSCPWYGCLQAPNHRSERQNSELLHNAITKCHTNKCFRPQSCTKTTLVTAWANECQSTTQYNAISSPFQSGFKINMQHACCYGDSGKKVMYPITRNLQCIFFFFFFLKRHALNRLS